MADHDLSAVRTRRRTGLGRLSFLLALLAVSLACPLSPAHAEPLRVVVTSKPAHSLVAAIMDGVASPGLLVEGTASPHTYAMRPSDAAKVSRATLLVRISPSLEPFTDKLVRALPRSVTVLTLADVAGLTKLRRRTGGAFEHEAAADHDHDRSSRHTHDNEPGDTDPHIWLDPANAKTMARAISAALSSAAPADAARFRANADRLTLRIDRMSDEIAREIAPVSQRPFLVLHDAYQYFEHRFALRPIGSILVDPDEQPSARRLTTLRRKVQNLEAVCVFAEPNHQPRVVAGVIEGTRVRTAVLDPEGLLLPRGPDLYIELMRKLSASMLACLSPAA
jgi:zinc transport system substrate-binding protein